MFDWENAIALHAMQGNRASSRPYNFLSKNICILLIVCANKESREWMGLLKLHTKLCVGLVLEVGPEGVLGPHGG